MWRGCIVLLVFALPLAAAEPVTHKVRLTGLFAKDRIDDLKELLKQWPEVELRSVDFDHAEAEFRFDADKFFGKVKKDDYTTRLDEKLRGASQSTFGAKPLSTTPRAKLERISIPVVGLDCKACCLAAYETVARVEGVEQATASFKDGLITALVDPQKIDRVKLVEVLTKRGVTVAKP